MMFLAVIIGGSCVALAVGLWLKLLITMCEKGFSFPVYTFFGLLYWVVVGAAIVQLTISLAPDEQQPPKIEYVNVENNG